MTHEFMIRDASVALGTAAQTRDLVLLVADEKFQKKYRRRLIETGKTEKVLMVGSYHEAFAESSKIPFSAHIIYSNLRGGTFFTFAKEVREAKGSAYPIIIVGNDSDLEEKANEIRAKYLKLGDKGHIKQALNYV